MDTSETYIKMRIKAIPYLGMGMPPVFSVGAEVQWLTTFVCTDIAGNFYYSTEDKTFQLERQDQLQEMVGDFSAQCDELLMWFDKGEPPLLGERKITSMEQLWLAFVMKELYNKIWNGEEWA